MRIFMTGGSGFCGTAFQKAVREGSNWSVEAPTRMEWDIRFPWVTAVPEADFVFHFAANVKARQSTQVPLEFILDNVMGTYNVLELARKIQPKLFVYISTAEALGGCGRGYLTVNAPMKPANPYAATKGAGELLAYSYFRSYDLPVVIVRTQCVWSMDQADQTKAVPIIKKTILAGQPVKIYQRSGVVGMRQWIHVDGFSRALMDLLPTAVRGEIYHIIGPERDNRQMAKLVAHRLDRELLTEPFEVPARDDVRYALEAEYHHDTGTDS